MSTFTEPTTATEPTRESWLAERRTGLGGSDAPAVLGISSWSTPYELWAEKSGLIEAGDLSDKECVQWGDRLEGVIGEAYAEKTGRTVTRWPKYTIARHNEHHWMICTPDATQVGHPTNDPPGFQKRGDLQIKTANQYKLCEWQDEPPLAYQVQLQHELAVTGDEWGTLAVLIGGQTSREFDFLRNERFIAALMEQEEAFWDRVQSGNPPPVDGSKATTSALLKLHPEDSGEAIDLPAEAAQWDKELAEVKANLKALEARENELKNQLRDAIGKATYGLLPDGGRYSWKTQNKQGYSVAPSSTRILRRLTK
ncbi:hypothetical protein LCGC14_0772430 [marine sediment metagenome]|uniref:YqaJ viral recombinase domain-containing protein n=1 Tax=marine sediment metagenome TaxID=412755 RepID=A0A0F9T4T5_9ZZZZ